MGLTFGYAMIISETALGRLSRKSPIGAFKHFTKSKFGAVGGWVNAIIPIIIVPYYSVIGGWVLRYFVEYVKGNEQKLAQETYFTEFISDAASSEIFFLIFATITILIIALGVNAGVERLSKIMMPALLVLALGIAIFSITRPGAFAGVYYVFVPDFSKFSLMTVVAATGQMFYSLSIAMGILYTFGSYMKDHVDIEKSTYEVAIVDSVVAILATLMIIPSVFAFSKGDVAGTLNAGPSLLFISLPKIFADMAGGRIVGLLFFVMVLFAAMTSSIALLESAVSTFEDEFHLSRVPSSILMGIIMAGLGTLSAMGYNALAFIKPIGMQFLDFFDFLTNSVMMPIAALTTCILLLKFTGTQIVIDEVKKSSSFWGTKIYIFTIKYLSPILLVVIFVSSILSAFGIITV
ncbi:hypothetical protein P261_02714 [Lachnospiraceae bacterium TWA4]|nr:hypothetical protein P261_02714 [Lachnospiraceae bacterium TWA4]